MRPTHPPKTRFVGPSRRSGRHSFATAASRLPISSSARQYQDQGRRSEHAQLLAAQQVAATGSWEFDLQAGRLTCSDELHRIFDWRKGRLPDLSCLKDAVHPDDRPVFDSWRRASMAGEPPPQGCSVRIVRGGQIGRIICRSAITAVDHGRPRTVTGTVQDITDGLALEGVCEAEPLYRGIFEQAVWGVFQTTEDGRYLTVNPALARIYGYDSREALLAAMTDIGRQLYVDPDRREEFVRLMRENGVVTGFESAIYRRDGSVIWISESCREVRASNGDLLYYEGTVEDATDRVRAEQAVLAAREAAERSNQAKSLFLANMSHELRTPLNAVLGFSEMLSNELFGPLGDAHYREFAQDIYDSGKHLLEIINAILDISKVEAGRLTLDEQDFDLGTLMLDCERLVAEAARTGGVMLKIEPPPEPIWMRADPTRLKQILLNLLSNAVKFTPPGNRVSASARHGTDGGLEITVADHGIGMTEEELVRAMEPFQQIDNSFSRRYQGTGLGLPLAKSLVELHAGTLAIASAPDAGTVATVMLPDWRVAPMTALV
jgi:PAS domain S-box-containing protein